MIVTNGQAAMRYAGAFATARDSISGSWTAFQPNQTFTLKEGGTMEVRTDVLNANQDDAFVGLGVSSGMDAYLVFLDRNELTMLKVGDAPTKYFFSYYFWDQSTLPTPPFTLSLGFTWLGEDLKIVISVLNQTKPDVVMYRKTVYDTAGQEEMLPNRSVKGLLMHPEELIKPYTGRGWMPFTGVAYINTDQAPTVPVEVTIDNFLVLAYPAPDLAIERAVCLSWPEDTKEEQIVVGAASVEGPWTPWPEPIFKRSGQICMDVPITASERYFKLMPGTQYSDDFNPPQPPYTKKDSWIPAFVESGDASRILITNLDGTLQFHGVSTPIDGRFGLTIPGPSIVVRDFSASLDILDWDPNGVEQAASIGARLLGSNGYYGIVNFNEWSQGTGTLHLFPVGGTAAVGSMITFTRGKNYRLCFSGVGSILSVRLYDLENLAEPISRVQLTNNTSSQGSVAVATAVYGISGPMTLDNFLVTGTKP